MEKIKKIDYYNTENKFEKMEKEEEKENRIYRKLLLFFKDNSVIHFKLNTGEFRNGIIRILDKDNSVMIIKEFKIGNISVLFEDIDEATICEYENKLINEDL